MAMFISPLKPQSRLQQIFLTLLTNTSNCRANPSRRGSPFSSLRFLSTISQPPPPPSSTADFLVTSLGLSPESALEAAQAIGREPNANSDAVVALFKRYGFSSAQIAAVFTKIPRLLWSNPEKTLDPKLAFLSQNGISGKNLAHIVSKDPFILNRGVDKQIAPCIRLLKSLFRHGSDDIVVHFSQRHGTRVVHHFSEAMAPNIETLRRNGVPQKNIEKMLVIRPRSLSRDVDEFAEMVRKAKEIGLDTSTLMFIHGIATLSGMKHDKWLSKVEVFKRFGWSDEQVRSLIAKQPQIMDCSEERLSKSLEFLRKELNWGPAETLRYPVVILLSVEKRLSPRYAVLKELISKNLVDKKRMGSAFLIADDRFVTRYLQSYLHKIPQLLDLYQNNIKS